MSRPIAVFKDRKGRRVDRYGRSAAIRHDSEPERVGPLYLLDFGVYAFRLTAGWHISPRGTHIPMVDETWIVRGYTREEALAFYGRRRDFLASLVAPVELLASPHPDAEVLLRYGGPAGQVDGLPPRDLLTFSPIDDAVADLFEA